MSSYQDLVAKRAALQQQQADLDKQIAAARQSERASVINQIRALMAEHGLSVADLGAAKTRTKASKSGTGRKVAPKYRNSETGDTWSGRGLQPKWLKAALASGRKLSDFAL